MWFKFNLVLTFLISSANIFNKAKGDAPIIQTKYGSIAGYSELNSFNYLGIPYAQPPINELRWKTPQDLKPWYPNVLNATKFQSACPQVLNCDQTGICPTSISENCLYLNVFAPQTIVNGEKKAVMVFIHGESFQNFASNPFNSSMFASIGDVIIVTLNYRLGVLGFLVTGLFYDQIEGNFGILDQKQAIQWVFDNIDAFGGDNKRITLFGHSAGSQSVAIHLLSADMQPFFTNAIIQSSPMTVPFRDYEEMTVLYIQFAHFINCSYGDLDCLQNKTTSEIISAQILSEKRIVSLRVLEYFEPWAPWLDGENIKGQLLDLDSWLRYQNFTLKPFMIGTLTEECILSIYNEWKEPMSEYAYVSVMTVTLKGAAHKVLDEYPPQKNSTDQRNLMAEFTTRWVFSCSSRQFLEAYISNSLSIDNIYYMYVFDFPLDFDGWNENQTYCKGHTCQGADLPYTFDIPDANFSSIGHAIAIDHIQYWSNFAKYQTPNGNERMQKDTELYFWPEYDPKYRNNLRFRAPENRIEIGYLEKECDFLDSIGYNH